MNFVQIADRQQGVDPLRPRFTDTDQQPSGEGNTLLPCETEGFKARGRVLAAPVTSPPPPPEDDSAGATMIYTSGTTGKPKGAFRRRAGNPEQTAAMLQFIGYSPDDVYLTTGPLYHSGPGGFMGIALAMGQTIVERIAQSHLMEGPARPLRAGDVVSVRPRHVLTHDNTAAVMKKFASIGATAVADSDQPVFVLDHDIQNRSEANLDKYARIEEFAATHGIRFHPAGTGTR